MSPVLELNGVTVRFGGIVALDDVSFHLDPGEICGLIGANGAGKTTLFDVISGVRQPDAGVTVLGGSEMTRWSPHRRARSGLRRTFQRPQVFGWLTVEQNLLVAIEWHGGGGGVVADLVRLPTRSRLERSRRRQVDDVIDWCGLNDYRVSPASSLPLGIVRLVELGRALVDKPTVLLLDEPTSGLDSVETERMAEVIESARTDLGCAVLLIEHDVRFVLDICERVIALDLGRVIADSSPDDVSRDPAVRKAYLGIDHIDAGENR